MSLDSDVQTRITVALPPLDERARERAAEQDWDLTRLDPQDPDERSVLIRLAHPDLDDAIDKGHDELIVDATPMNPRLHLAIHEVVGAQIIDNHPPLKEHRNAHWGNRPWPAAAKDEASYLKHVADMARIFAGCEGAGDAWYPNRKHGPLGGMDR